jgi:hypothetical protein
MCAGFIDVIVADHLPSGNKKAILSTSKTSRFGILGIFSKMITISERLRTFVL